MLDRAATIARSFAHAGLDAHVHAVWRKSRELTSVEVVVYGAAAPQVRAFIAQLAKVEAPARSNGMLSGELDGIGVTLFARPAAVEEVAVEAIVAAFSAR
jgi:hypothetical protein